MHTMHGMHLVFHSLVLKRQISKGISRNLCLAQRHSSVVEVPHKETILCAHRFESHIPIYYYYYFIFLALGQCLARVWRSAPSAWPVPSQSVALSAQRLARVWRSAPSAWPVPGQSVALSAQRQPFGLALSAFVQRQLHCLQLGSKY